MHAYRDNARRVDESGHTNAALEIEELLRAQRIVVARVPLGVVHVASVVRVHEHNRVGEHHIGVKLLNTEESRKSGNRDES